MRPKRRCARKGRFTQPDPNTRPDDLYDYADEPEPRRNPPPHVFDVEKLPVIDDWPEKVPITEAEIQVFERWFSDVFDEMFGSVDMPKDLQVLSRDDNEKP
ncbi:hypothetical protein IGS74_17760 [Aureimonas sp. OT7]|uniref:hypothetical protein n=1 Tax=Aureimonas sp. OT7 TaxID=2816454 RepID=UPI001783501C|nr:hypothetical protein [Aureimonas sp. OT7]QOG08885.1 hypothetical protein IGS74_17760 [Aureimonas sp. OT7]